MGKFKRLATIADELVKIEIPLSKDDLQNRTENYAKMSSDRFNARHRVLLATENYKPVTFEFNGVSYIIQLNHCTDPFCRWFGDDQLELKKLGVRGRKRYKYKLVGSPEQEHARMIVCNDEPSIPGAVGGCITRPISTWSAAEEIKRLATLNSVVDLEPKYEFHKPDCDEYGTTPSEQAKNFYSYGKSKTNCDRYKCKACGKLTNVLPLKEKAFSYHQQRSDILPTLAAMLVNRVPVRRTCEILGIGSQTYYNKLEYIYMRCLEFIERYEKKALETKTFDKLWINSDVFIYYLNNARHKFAGNTQTIRKEDFRKMQTRIIVSGDIYSRYIFRADVAYDWEITKELLEEDTLKYKCDHMERNERKNARLEHSYFPQPPSLFDIADPERFMKAQKDYESEVRKFETRLSYVPGLHVSANYTAVAHFWLLRQLLKVNDWYFVTDDDGSLKNSIFRVFKKEVRDGYANYFLCKVGREKSLGQAMKEYSDAKRKLEEWCDLHGQKSDYEVALAILTDQLNSVKFFDLVEDGSGYKHIVRLGNLIQHPLASQDVGYREVGILTDLSGLNNSELAKLLMQVNNRPTDTFMQQIRRRISLLERPLVTARAEKKSYIYANYSPQYAQYLVTILRTFYNFCDGKKDRTGQVITPAMKLGITNKIFNWHDIIYYK